MCRDMVKFTLEQTMKAQEESGNISLLFNFGARRGWVFNATPWPLYSWKRRPGTHFIGGWAGPRAGLYGYGKSRPFPNSRTEVRSPDRPTGNESLYRRRCPSSHCCGMAVRDVVNPKNMSFALPTNFNVIWYSQELDEC
jgi:hypothetical protein